MPAPPQSDDPVRAATVELLEARRDVVRLDVLRANRAIAMILLMVAGLGAILVASTWKARRNQARAERAEVEATERLWNASLAQARAENLSTQAGHREAALAAVRAAAEIRPSPELRNEAIAALWQRDLVQERQWPCLPNAYGLNFDPDLRYYLIRYQPTVLSLYRTDDNHHVRDFPMPEGLPEGANVGDFLFSRTGKYTAIRYNFGPFVLYNTETGETVRTIGADPTTERYSWPPTFTDDDRLIGMGFFGSKGSQLLYDVEKGEVRELPSIPEPLRYTGGYANPVRISPRGDVLVGFEGRKVHLVDAATGEIRQTITAPSIVQASEWDRQGERLSFSCDNYTLLVWEIRTNRVVQMGGATLVPWVQDFSQDGSLLLTFGSDGMTRLWDVFSAKLLCEMKGVQSLKISRDGKRLAGNVPGQYVGLWRIEQPTAMTPIRGRERLRATVWQQDLSPDGRFALWAPPAWVERQGFEVFDLQRNESVWVSRERKVTIGFRPGFRQIWQISGNQLLFYPIPETKGVTSADFNSPIQEVVLPEGFVATHASFTADGRTAAVSGLGKRTIVIGIDSANQVVELEAVYASHQSIAGPGSASGSGCMAISPDGRWVAAGRYVDGGNPLIWDARTGKVATRLPATPGHVTFSPDGRYLATVGARTGRVWSVGDWKVVWERRRDALLENVGAVAFTGDGDRFVWTRGTTQVEWVSLSGDDLAEWNFSHLNFVSGLRFSANGRYLFASGFEGNMALVNLDEFESRLGELNLGWPLKTKATPPQLSGPWPDWFPLLLGIAPVALVAALGLRMIRRQNQLTGEFVHATEVASRHARELAAEREVSELKSRFVTTVSHEFRTPLGITMSAVELLRHYEERLPPDEKTQLLDDIHGATRHMAELMEQVLVLGRVDAGKVAFHPSPLDLDQLAGKITDEMLSATNRKCPIEWRPESSLEGASADESLLRHILTNLLSNGVKYSPEGAVVTFTGRREGPMAVFTIEDNGIGIPETDLPHLFEAFHRGGNVGEIPGTGLGLVIIKRCADLHGGSIQVDSHPGKGTKFTVRIPAWGEEG